ncbi:hypothetical protein EWM64_g9562 [Hericium alpestre]|uniref:Uncharacterized protein n=1 Tax=Hericium alpestre TaxID=135208 RepID=A0A4Y9ZLZ2_9AGAM|nr:hypothetical protein EWM64_g9562 [Hericium alpestre]
MPPTEQQREIWPVIAEEFTTAVDVGDVQALMLPDTGPYDFRDADDSAERAYAVLFRRMPAVRSLVLGTSSDTARAPLKALMDRANACFPRLRELTLVQSNLRARDGLDDTRFSELLETVLLSRRSNEAIEKLIVRCNLNIAHNLRWLESFHRSHLAAEVVFIPF